VVAILGGKSSHPTGGTDAAGKAELPLRGQASNHGAQADRLEILCSPLSAGGSLAGERPGATEKLSREEIAAWFRRGLVLGTDPSSPETWGRLPITTNTLSKWRR